MHTPDVPTSGHPPQSARPDAWEADGVLRAPLPRAPVPPSGEGPAPPHRDAERGRLERGAAALQPFWWRDAARQTWPWRRQPAEPAAAWGDRERFWEPPRICVPGTHGAGRGQSAAFIFPGELIFSPLNAHKSLEDSPALRFC